MRQKDIAIIAAVVLLSVVVAVVASRLIVSKPQSRQQKAEVVQAISRDFPTPDERYFNKDSVDATEPIRIGNNSNPDPFREAAKQ